MQVVIETITPAKAVEYLKTSLGNRPISDSRVNDYAECLKNGKWLSNGETVKFDDGGHLMDGHHRLLAIEQAGIPLQTVVCRGIQPEAFVTIDQGRSKTLGQLLAMQNVENYNIVASVIGGNRTLVLNGRLWTNNGAKVKGTNNAEYYDEYMRDAKGYQEAAAFAREMYQKARMLRPAWIGSLYYFLTHTGCYKKEYVANFFRGVCNLNTSGINAADELRYFIIRNDRKEKRLEDSYLFAIVCKAWNYYVNNKPVKRYSFDSEKESYPKLQLNIED